MQFDREWLDFGTAKSHEKRIEFLAEAWEAAAATGTVASGGSLQQGDVLYFYTQRIHRAPPPPLYALLPIALWRLLPGGAHRGRAGAGRHVEGEVGRASTLSTY